VSGYLLIEFTKVEVSRAFTMGEEY